MEYIEFTVDPE